MAAFVRCDDFIGGTTLLEADPPILSLRDVIFVPFNDPKSRAGIFDHGQKLVLQSWYFRTQHALLPPQSLSTGYTYDGLQEQAPDAAYIYGGWLHDHFGHFLLSSLCRQWSDLASRNPTLKILVHSEMEVADWFARPWFASLFGALGIEPDRVVRLERAVRIDTLLLPAPALEEENFVHRAYARMCNRLGARIARARIMPADNRPVFFSKRQLRHGVQTLVNEDQVLDRLERHGVEIVCPETLPFEEQVALWHNRPFIASFVSSALHSSIFAPARRMIVLTYEQSVISNYALIDRANDNRTLYLQPTAGTIENIGPGDGFSTRYRATDPVVVADTILRVLDFQQRAAASRAGEPLNRKKGYWSLPGAAAVVADPEDRLVNVAIDRPGRMSSAHPWVVHTALSATSGLLTGRFQFHTDRQVDPWWEIGFERTAHVRAVRLFNRIDNGQDRCSRFRIETRLDDGDWRLLHEQSDPLLFGGLDGTPFTCIAPTPVAASHLRVTLLGDDYLHLDQVEVIGHLEPIEAEAAAGNEIVVGPRRKSSILARLFGQGRAS